MSSSEHLSKSELTGSAGTAGDRNCCLEVEVSVRGLRAYHLRGITHSIKLGTVPAHKRRRRSIITKIRRQRRITVGHQTLDSLGPAAQIGLR